MSSMFVGAQIFCENQRIVDPTTFEALLAWSTQACAPHWCSKYYTITTSATVGNIRPITNAKDVSRLWKRATTVQLNLLAPSDIEHASEVVLTFERSDRPGGEVAPGMGQVQWRRSVEIDELAHFLNGIKRSFVVTGGMSGYVHASTQSVFTLAELGFSAASPMWPHPAPLPDGSIDKEAVRRAIAWKHEEDTNDRVRSLQSVLSHVGPRLRGTYWGTLLGPELVAELGGLSRIIRDAPVVVAESLTNGGVYLQLTPSPEPITTTAMQRGLVELERFLEPVLVPVPLYWAARNGVA